MQATSNPHKLELRPYQHQCIEAIYQYIAKGKKRQLVSLPTAAGKTIIFATLIQCMGKRALILVGSRELLDQTRHKFIMLSKDANVGLVDQNHKEFTADVVVSSIQSASLPTNLENLYQQRFEVIVVDECHHAAADSYQMVLSKLNCFDRDGPLLVGFTATPFRSDNKGLKKTFDVVAFEKNTRELIDGGYLSRPIGKKIATNIDFSKLVTKKGDFKEQSLADVLDTSAMHELVVQTCLKQAFDKKTLIFCITVKHAQALADVFNESGITAKAIWGTLPKKKRELILHDFKRGKIQVLCNCNLLTEGFDEPSVECVVIARPTKSKALYQQMVGRGLRLFPNKTTCLILDFTDESHTICNVVELLDTDEAKRDINRNVKLLEDSGIPLALDHELQAVLLDCDLLTHEFTWERNGSIYSMNANGSMLYVEPENNGYSAHFHTLRQPTVCLAKQVDFEYAFAAAQDYARTNRHLFVLSDRKADWRNKNISLKQKQKLLKAGYKQGIEQLTRGQASDIIKNEILRR